MRGTFDDKRVWSDFRCIFQIRNTNNETPTEDSEHAPMMSAAQQGYMYDVKQLKVEGSVSQRPKLSRHFLPL